MKDVLVWSAFFTIFFYFSFNARYIGNIVITRIVILGFQHFFFLRAARSAYNWGGGGGGGKGKRVLSHVEAYKRQFTVGEKHKSLSIFLSFF